MCSFFFFSYISPSCLLCVSIKLFGDTSCQEPTSAESLSEFSRLHPCSKCGHWLSCQLHRTSLSRASSSGYLKWIEFLLASVVDTWNPPYDRIQPPWSCLFIRIDQQVFVTFVDLGPGITKIFFFQLRSTKYGVPALMHPCFIRKMSMILGRSAYSVLAVSNVKYIKTVKMC